MKNLDKFLSLQHPINIYKHRKYFKESNKSIDVVLKYILLGNITKQQVAFFAFKILFFQLL